MYNNGTLPVVILHGSPLLLLLSRATLPTATILSACAAAATGVASPAARLPFLALHALLLGLIRIGPRVLTFLGFGIFSTFPIFKSYVSLRN
jgi:hypothetical protein